jgi:methionyl-tRNA formyltransferase
MGTPAFALPALKTIHDSPHEIILVITQPDRPKGRGLKLTPPPVKELALSLDLPVIQPLKIKDPAIVQELKNLMPELILIVAYGQLLPKEILALPQYGCVNVHPSLLPKYRGPAPIPWAILRGEKNTGVTTMFLGEGVDNGPILLQEEVEIEPMDTAATLHDKLAIAGAKLLLKTIDGLEKGTIFPIAQPDELATYAPKLSKEAGRIDWTKPAQEIHNQVRATNPWPGAYTFYEGEMLKIWQTRLPDSKQEYTQGMPGEILEIEPASIRVQTGDQPLFITEIQRPGGQRMPAKEYVKGHRLLPGSLLG